MATITDIATRALRKSGITAQDEAPTADEIANAVDAFNMMVHAWKLHGADFEFTDQESADTFDLGDEFQEGTVYMLASRLSPDYMVPVSFDADAWFRAFQASKTEIESVTFDKALTYVPSLLTQFTYTSDS